MKSFFKLAVLMIAFFLSGLDSWGQTVTPGDIAFLSVNADNADEFTIVLLEDLPAATVVNFTDNGFTSATVGRTGEGFLTFTVPSGGYTKGQVFTWTGGMTVTGTPWSSGAPTNFAFNASGDQLFAFQGPTANWAAQTGITLIAALHYSGGTWITTGTASASLSYLPSSLSTSFVLSFLEDNGYYADGTSAATSVTKSDSKANLQAEFFSASDWYKSDDRLTIPAYSITVASGGLLTPPILNADVTNNDVDHNIDITFTNDATWLSSVTAVKINGTAAVTGVDYLLSSGNLQLLPSGGNPLLTTSGAKAVSIEATGYNNASVTQQINAGAVVSSSTAVISSALVLNATRTVTCTAKDQYNNLALGYSFKFDLVVTDNNGTTDESYLIDGIAYTTSANNISIATMTNASGVATFTIQIPSFVDGNDGMSLQVQLMDGTTNVGTAFVYASIAPGISITGSDPSALPFYPATNSNILYMLEIAVTNDAVTLSEANFTTAGTYSSTDILASGFTLRYSADNVLTAGDATLGALSSTTGSGEVLNFTGLTQNFVIGTAYLFVTANIDAAAVVGHSISAQALANTDFVFSGSPVYSGSLFNTPNLHSISAVPVMSELVIPQYIGSKSAASSNNTRTPIAYCIKIDNLAPSTTYDLKVGMGLTTDDPTNWGAGNVWNGTAFSGQTISNFFVSDGSGSSGPLWIYIQPTGNASRFDAGHIHNLRIAYTIAGGSFGVPNFITTKTTTALDIATAERTLSTADDGAFIKGITPAANSGKYLLLFNNEAGTGDPVYAYQVRTTSATNTSQSEFPSAINEVYSQVAPSVSGEFAAVVPIGVNNPDGIRRIEFRNADNTYFGSYTNATGNWGINSNTAAITRREVDTIDFTFVGEPTNHATAFTASTTTITTIPLTWTDATGTVLPENYLIKGSTISFAAIVEPVDGTPETNALLVQNVAYGVEGFTFSGLTPNTTYYFKIYPYTNTGANIDYKTGTGTAQTSATTLSEITDKTLNLTSVLPEGLYIGGGELRQASDDIGPHWPAGIADHITVELHDGASYGTIVYSAVDVELSTTGMATVVVPAEHDGSYFITIRHRNSLKTVSATAVSFAGTTISQSFGSPADVFGANLLQMADLGYALYGGDVNQDDIIDSSDAAPVDNEATMASAGYMPEDVNGDGLIDSSDAAIIDNNAAMAIGSVTP